MSQSKHELFHTTPGVFTEGIGFAKVSNKCLALLMLRTCIHFRIAIRSISVGFNSTDKTVIFTLCMPAPLARSGSLTRRKSRLIPLTIYMSVRRHHKTILYVMFFDAI